MCQLGKVKICYCRWYSRSGSNHQIHFHNSLATWMESRQLTILTESEVEACNIERLIGRFFEFKSLKVTILIFHLCKLYEMHGKS